LSSQDDSVTSTFDTAKAETFAARFLGALNDGALCLMAAIGHRAGLFDAMRGQPLMTSTELAERAGLKERYVREWLGAMATAGVVEVEADGSRFRLPDEHAASLTSAAAADNMAVFAQYISHLGSVEDDVLECFHKGGGVPYDRYHRFHEIMAEDSGQSVMSGLEAHVIPLVPGLHERLTAGIRVLDLGCGRGRIINRLAGLYPKSRFAGVDLSEEAIAFARGETSASSLTNVSFAVADLSDFDEKAEPESFDLITTFDAVHDQAQPQRLLRGIYRALASDGVYLMQDIHGSSFVHRNLDHPLGTLLYTISCLHCMTVSLAQGGEGLGAMWGEEKAREYLERAGFTSIETKRIAHDLQNNWYVVRKG